MQAALRVHGGNGRAVLFVGRPYLQPLCGRAHAAELWRAMAVRAHHEAQLRALLALHRRRAWPEAGRKHPASCCWHAAPARDPALWTPARVCPRQAGDACLEVSQGHVPHRTATVTRGPLRLHQHTHRRSFPA